MSTISGTSGNDSLIGTSAAETIDGGAGQDTIRGEGGSDRLIGGATAFGDFVDYSSSPVGLNAAFTSGPSESTIQDGLGGTDTISDFIGIIGSSFNDSIIGTNGAASPNISFPVILIGGDGDDTLGVGIGANPFATLRGGAGDDLFAYPNGTQPTLDYSTSPAGIIADLGSFTIQDGFGTVDRIEGIAGDLHVIGSPHDDSIDGSALIFANLVGGLGDDTLIGERVSSFAGEPGNDLIIGGDGLSIGVFNSIDFTASPGGVVVDLVSGTAEDGYGFTDSLTSIEWVTGSLFADVLFGSNVAEFGEFLFGGLGDDTLRGGAGDDLMSGGTGDFEGFTDFDTADYANSPAGVSVDLALPFGTAEDGFGGTDALQSLERVLGSAFRDTLTGGNADEVLEGNAGADLLAGGTGDDTLLGDGAEALAAGAPAEGLGNDTLNGGPGNDSSAGGGGIDTAMFVGTRASHQVQFGADGATVSGADGTDTLTGIELLQFDDETVAAPIFVSIGDAARAEGNAGGANLVFTISLSGVSVDPVTVTATTANGTAAAGSDYTATTQVVTIPGGQASATFSVPILGDTVVEPDESFTVTLSNPVGATLGDASATGTITNDDAALTIANVSISEGNGGTTNLVFTIARSGSTAQAATVTASTSNGTASAGSDYTAASGIVTIPAGQASATFTVVVAGDTLAEPDETLTVTLSDPVGASLGAQASAIGTILNDDTAAPILSIGNASIAEGNAGNSNLVFTVSLSEAAAQDVSVQAATQDEIARAGSDYAATASTVTIPAGQTSATFSVPVNGDTEIEIDESFAVALSNPTGGATISATAGAARGFILNDDLTPTIAITGQALAGTGGDDFLVGSAGNDSIAGEGGADTEFGNEQSDILLGGAGNDFILGDFPGNFLDGSADFIDAGEGNDNVFGGGGNDTVFGGAGDDLIGGDFGDNLIFGGDGNNALIGFGGADTIQGGNDGDIVFGLSGPDVISTKNGFDLIIAGGDGDGPTDADFIDVADGGSQVFAGSGDDTIFAGDGPDFMLGESGADIMRAGGSNDVVIAGPGNDTLEGGAGDDVIIPEGGDDSIAGGPGADLFRYPGGIAVNADRITDFVPADDTVELGAALGFATGAAALTAVTQAGADAVLILTGGSITFVGLDASALTAADFAIV